MTCCGAVGLTRFLWPMSPAGPAMGPWNLLLLGAPWPDLTEVSSNRTGGADVERTQMGALGKTVVTVLTTQPVGAHTPRGPC